MADPSGLFEAFFHLRKVPDHTAELRPWGGLVAPGILDCQDGSYLTSYQMRGPDLESAVESEVGGVHWALSNVLKRVLSPSAIWFEMRRRPSLEYPPTAGTKRFARLSDAERRRVFRREGAHYETECFLTLGYRPPSPMETLWGRFIYTSMPKRLDRHLQASLGAFQAQAARFADLLKGAVPYVTPLSDAALLRYLKYCCTGRDLPVHVPDPADDLDWYLADRDLSPGTEPILMGSDGPDEHLRVCTIRTFPDETIAGMLDPLRNVDFDLRFVTRFGVTVQLVLKPPVWSPNKISILAGITVDYSSKIKHLLRFFLIGAVALLGTAFQQEFVTQKASYRACIDRSRLHNAVTRHIWGCKGDIARNCREPLILLHN